jgi:hypothetical protein
VWSYLEWIDPQQITDIKHIANGGFGSVYQATWLNAGSGFQLFDCLNNRNVALKITDSNTRMFLNEVNDLYYARIVNPCISNVFIVIYMLKS